MQATFYALAAFARELGRPVDDGGLVGAHLADAYSQHADELRLVFEAGDHRQGLVVATRPAGVFPVDALARPRRNVATRFEPWHRRRVVAVRVAERDRQLEIVLDGGARLVAVLYGPRPNVLVATPAEAGTGTPAGSPGVVADAFLGAARLVGTDAPEVRPAPVPATAEAFAARLLLGGTDASRLRRAWPLFDDLLATEALARTGAADPFADPEALYSVCRALHADALDAPAPAVLWQDDVPLGVALVPLTDGVAGRVFGLIGTDRSVRTEPFDAVGEALRRYGRRRAAHVSLERRRVALARRLDAAIDAGTQRVAAMTTSLMQPSRADALEHEAHLLLAAPGAAAPGAETVAVPDVLTDGAPRTIRLDPARSQPANAAERYARARRLRAARTHAEARYDAAEADLAAVTALRHALDGCRDPDALDRFARDAADVLARLAPERAAPAERLPYTAVPVGAGYEAWVARSAADGDALTLRHTRPFDLWLHARGVAGAHVVLRLRGRADVPPRAVVEAAARLAAGASKARTSALVPVTVTPRKWVRKRRGDPPGRVVVEREEVVIVRPLGRGETDEGAA